jgi:2'-5' RNA ligase
MPDERPQQLRLFVACELPDETKAAFADVQGDLKRLGADRLRWVRPEGIHVTLKFLGGVDAVQVDAIRSALAPAIEPFELRLQPEAVGGFGGARLRVVWLGLGGEVDGLAALAGRVERALEPLGFPTERRPFAAHLTLARVPDQASVDERRRLAALIERYEAPSMPPVTLTHVALMQSRLQAGGSVYTRLAAFPEGAA